MLTHPSRQTVTTHITVAMATWMLGLRSVTMEIRTPMMGACPTVSVTTTGIAMMTCLDWLLAVPQSAAMDTERALRCAMMATQCQVMDVQRTVANLGVEIRTRMSGVTGSIIPTREVLCQHLFNGLLQRMDSCVHPLEVAIQTLAGRPDWMVTITCSMAVMMRIS